VIQVTPISGTFTEFTHGTLPLLAPGRAEQELLLLIALGVVVALVFVVSVVLIFLVGTVSALWLRMSLRDLLTERTAAELQRLQREVAMVADALGGRRWQARL
jgi:hypothetical protein